jgi:hypothetical protein
MRQREKGFVNRVIVRTGQGNVVYTIAGVIFEARNDGPRTEENNLLIYIHIYIYTRTRPFIIYHCQKTRNITKWQMNLSTAGYKIEQINSNNQLLC